MNLTQPRPAIFAVAARLATAVRLDMRTNELFRRIVAILLAAVSSAVVSPTLRAADHVEADVVVYGATPAGIAAAITAGRLGSSVLLVEPTDRIGGMVTNGLSHTDFRTFEGLTGTYLDFTHRVQAYYEAKYGKDSPQAECFRGTHAEPHVNLLIFEQMIAEQKTVAVVKHRRLAGLDLNDRDAFRKRITRASFVAEDGTELVAHADAYVDATYEGDLMAAAGVEFEVGREARREYRETLAPETADSHVQGYNFRFVMTRVAENRVMPAAPPGYRREDFAEIVPLLQSGRIKRVFCNPSGGVFKFQPPPLPNGKYDINDVSRAPVRLSLPDINDAWPNGDPATRQQIFDEHLRHNVGLLYFLQNDEAVPPAVRDEARQWGWCKDEFVENGHLPDQLYVREARRMIGRHLFTENDTNYAKGDARSVLHTDAIAMGDYGPNCHGTAHEGPRFGGRHTGEFYKPVAPYQISLGVLQPRDLENLLVPVACSASHVGFCALRLEPIWTSLGQAAGVAAHLSATRSVPAPGPTVPRLPVREVQRQLHALGAATIYVSDVLPGSPDFAAVQWWGTAGGLHGLAPTPATPGQRGKHIFGQYYEAYPGHAVELEKPLDPAVRSRWEALAESLGVPSTSLKQAETRGEFIRRAFALPRYVH